MNDWYSSPEALKALQEAEEIRLGRVDSPSYASFGDFVKEIMSEMEAESCADGKTDEILQG